MVFGLNGAEVFGYQAPPASSFSFFENSMDRRISIPIALAAAQILKVSLPNLYVASTDDLLLASLHGQARAALTPEPASYSLAC